jgi:hypothetical protein
MFDFNEMEKTGSENEDLLEEGEEKKKVDEAEEWGLEDDLEDEE